MAEHRACLSRVVVCLFFAGVTLALAPSRSALAQSSGGSRRDLFIVAHPDDDLLFMNPRLEDSIRTGHQVRTVFLTSGDAGKWWPYWTNREAGILAAYAQMAGVSNTWAETEELVGVKTLAFRTLLAAPSVSVVFLRLPDGNVDGHGFAATGRRSLRRTWRNSRAAMFTVDGMNAFSRDDLIETLASLMEQFEPDNVHIQDSSGRYGKDHADHQYGARFAFAAHAAYQEQRSHTLTSYRGYNISTEGTNLEEAAHDEKRAAFMTYASACASPQSDCLTKGFEDWAYRQYPIASLPELAGPIKTPSGRCLTVKRSFAVISGCGDPESEIGQRQWWSIHADGTIIANDGRCLLMGTRALLTDCSGEPEQRWTVFEDGQIRGFAGRCLDASDGSSTVRVHECALKTSQQWKLPG